MDILCGGTNYRTASGNNRPSCLYSNMELSLHGFIEQHKSNLISLRATQNPKIIIATARGCTGEFSKNFFSQKHFLPSTML